MTTQEEVVEAPSNFEPFEFTFRGFRMAGMEGLLQGLKFENPEEQQQIFQLVGREAKRAGRKRNPAWQSVQTLWWQGQAMERHSQEFQNFLDEAFEALFTQNKAAQEALLATGTARIVHAIGLTDPHKTVLTEQEFCSRLTRNRTKLQQQEGG